MKLTAAIILGLFIISACTAVPTPSNLSDLCEREEFLSQSAGAVLIVGASAVFAAAALPVAVPFVLVAGKRYMVPTRYEMETHAAQTCSREVPWR